jgi:hypothetical protein
MKRGKLGLLGFALEAFGGEDRNAEAFGRFMHRALALDLAATRRLWRARIDREHLVARGDDLGQGRNGEFGRAHEDDAHGFGSWARPRGSTGSP